MSKHIKLIIVVSPEGLQSPVNIQIQRLPLEL
ncbi:hypothetical protein PL10110_670035 [Planktothrix agardhii]|nr:hypothetical protein PL10110_670035 [Planktothrix agardhii]